MSALPTALLAFVLASTGVASQVRGDDYQRCSARLAPESPCMAEVSSLRPTQFAVGMAEIRLRSEKLKQKNPGRLDRYLRGKVIPVVVGPGGALFILDHHHLVRLLVDSGIAKFAYAVVKANWADLSVDEFWKRMQANHWAYLFDENGKGPLTPSSLPESVAGLKDDPYRSLAWLVRERDGFSKTDLPFAEFRWAELFRANIPRKDLEGDWDGAVMKASKLAASPIAKDFPGSKYSR